MKQIILLNKKVGETPLEALEVFRRRHKDYKNVPMTYAGRLDPMAEGLLLILADKEVKNKEKYLGLDKVYEFEVLFGFATDTYDILGKVVRIKIAPITAKKIINNLKHFRGKFKQKYPAYSSKTWEKARAGERIEEEEREVNVKSLKLLSTRKVSAQQLLSNIERRIKKVRGDFRQKEIQNLWKKHLKKGTYTIASFKIRCSSGTYVRSIANSLGERMGTPALAFGIKRVKIGKWGQPSKRSIRS